jgi:glycosyltransferase involved in cell wall biosynthesis
VFFSIVTPSFNQASYLRGTIESVLNQQADLEYIVMDGGSTDGSREIISSYSDRLTHWQSERDGGQYDAINRGFAKSTGEIMGWLNSSDLYLPWTLSTVDLIFKSFPEIEWITSTMKTCIRGDGTFEDLYHSPGFSARRFYRGLHGGPGNSDYLQQESCFWRRSLWDKIGGAIDLKHASAGDYWLWSRFFKEGNVAAVDAPLAAFRFHDEAKSVATRYEEEVATITLEMRKEPASSYPEGSMSIIKWREKMPDGSFQTRWKLEQKETNSFLNARFAVENLIKKSRWPATKVLSKAFSSFSSQ